MFNLRNIVTAPMVPNLLRYRPAHVQGGRFTELCLASPAPCKQLQGLCLLILKLRNIIITTVLALLLASCGYYNPYVARSDSKPITLHRSMWSNQTNELGLETTFYHALSDWLRKSKAITMTESSALAEYELTGKIISVDYPEISYGSNRDANELRANIIIDFTIKENATGTVVWQKSNYRLSETLSTSTDPSTLLTNKKAALAEIADNVAEGIYLHFINSIMLPSE